MKDHAALGEQMKAGKGSPITALGNGGIEGLIARQESSAPVFGQTPKNAPVAP